MNNINNKYEIDMLILSPSLRMHCRSEVDEQGFTSKADPSQRVHSKMAAEIKIAQFQLGLPI